MSEFKPLTKDEAIRLSRALTSQLKRRMPTMRLEILYSRGVHVTDKNFVKPKPWVVRASRIAVAACTRLVENESDPNTVGSKQAGALVGLTRTFSSVMSGKCNEVDELEKDYPELIQFRESLLEIAAPEIQIGKAVEQKIVQLTLTPKDELLYGKGRVEGSAHIIDESGQLQEQSTIRSDVCWYLWLYWQQMTVFRKLDDLHQFLDGFRVEGLTRTNLVNICREIELRFKGRGRPAK